MYLFLNNILLNAKVTYRITPGMQQTKCYKQIFPLLRVKQLFQNFDSSTIRFQFGQ